MRQSFHPSRAPTAGWPRWAWPLGMEDHKWLGLITCINCILYEARILVPRRRRPAWVSARLWSSRHGRRASGTPLHTAHTFTHYFPSQILYIQDRGRERHHRTSAATSHRCCCFLNTALVAGNKSALSGFIGIILS